MECKYKTESPEREKGITRTGVVGIVANLFLVVFKSIVGLMAGSIAIVLDAVNNLTDIISSVVTIVGIKMACKSPDADHPFGHGRVEYFSAIIISFIIFATGIVSMCESINKIIHPVMPDYGTAALIVTAAAIFVKIFLSVYVQKQGKKYMSDALMGAGKDAMFDAVISVATLIGVIVTLIWHITLDGWIGALISVFILKTGIEMLINPINRVMGFRPDRTLTESIREDVKSEPGVIGVYDLILHDYGPSAAIGSINIEIPDTMSAREIHVLSAKIHNRIQKEYNIFLTVGIFAVDVSDSTSNKQSHLKDDMLSYEGVKGCHGIFIDDSARFVSFDVLLDFKSKDDSELLEKLKQEILEDFPGYEVDIKTEIDYTD